MNLVAESNIFDFPRMVRNGLVFCSETRTMILDADVVVVVVAAAAAAAAAAVKLEWHGMG